MKFGLSFLPDSSPDCNSATSYYNSSIELSKIADSMGLSFIKMTEHYLHPYGGYCPSPLMFLTAVAMKTKSIRLMTGCILPAFHHPIQIASEASMLDVISNGRLDVGFGRAYLPYEFSSFGVSIDDSREKYTSTILAVKDLWVNPSSSAKAKFFNYSNASILPKVVQNPHPPIWGAAVNSRQSFAWLGEQGFGLLISAPIGGLDQLSTLIDIYRASFKSSYPNQKPQVFLSLPLVIRESDNEAIRDSDLYLNHYKNTWADATKEWNSMSSKDYPKYSGLSNFIRSNSPQGMRDKFQAIAGSPETVFNKIVYLEELLGLDAILWQIDFGAQSFISSYTTLELFTNQVMPNLEQISNSQQR